MSATAVTSEQLFRACVHCGLCLEHCPTYVQLGVEMAAPRGRILLMHGILDGRIEPTAAVRNHLDLCLGCRACETACPSGVRYGALLERFRDADRATRKPTLSQRLLDYLLFNVFPNRRRLASWLTLGRAARAIGLDRAIEQTGLLDMLPAWLAKLLRMLPPNEDPAEPLCDIYPAAAPRAHGSFFIGCIGEAMFAQTNRATLRVLNANGVTVECPDSQVCCGAIHAHAGRTEDARTLARKNIEALTGNDPIVTNIAGCGAMLKHYAELLADDPQYAAKAAAFTSRVRDISEYLVDLPLTPPTHELRARVTYHDPCHLCHAQGIRRQPRDLLRAIPGLELVDLPESEMCCGAAGTYNLTQPEMSAELAARKLACIDRTGAAIVATGNAGCILQLRAAAESRVEVSHPIELLDRAYTGESAS